MRLDIGVSFETMTDFCIIIIIIIIIITTVVKILPNLRQGVGDPLLPLMELCALLPV
jgi:hypothetical protein